MSALGSSLSAARRDHLAFLLPHNNHVLIVGGTSGGTALATAELFRPWDGNFHATAPMSAARAAATGSPLALDGQLLVAGGSGWPSSELYGFATVKTDKDDYEPGQVVTITGTGWLPGETVSLRLNEDPHVCNPRILTSVADDNGNIINTEFAPEEHHVGVRFYLVASGQTSGLTAQHTFTDARVINGTSLTYNSTTVACPAGSCTLSSPLAVPTGATITASVTVTGSGPNANQNAWQSTGWVFSNSATPPAAGAEEGTANCANTGDHGAGTATESFATTAPSSVGTYYAHFRAYRNNTCQDQSGAQAPSGAFTITNSITVVAPNAAPTLNAIGNKSVNEGSLLTFTATATDPNAGQTLTFSLDSGSPAGASITSGGVFTWTPTEAQGPGDYPVTIRVTDNDTPALDDFETISVQLNEVNQTPVLGAIGNKTVDEEALLTFTAAASDSDVPANTLTFSLDSGAPAGASITARRCVQLDAHRSAGSWRLPGDHPRH